MIFKNDEQRLEAIGVARQLFAEGKTVKEVARALCLSESQVRSLRNSIDDKKTK